MTAPLKILIACSWWGSELSVPVYFKALADELGRRGHRVVLLVTGGAREHPAAEPPDVDATDDDAPEILFWPDGRGASWRDARFAWRLMRRVRPDICIANFSTVNVLTILGRALRVPVRIAYYHTLLEQVRADGGGTSIGQRLRIGRKSVIYRLATDLVAVSERAAQDLRNIYRLPPDKITCFHNAAPDPLDGRPAAFGEREPLALAAIRLDHSKGPDLLIDAVAQLVKGGQWPEGFAIDVFGSGPLEDEYRARIRHHRIEHIVRLPGRQPPSQVQATMARARFSVLPSRSDNCPLAAIESLAYGTPVIGARAGGIPELIDEHSGVLVKANDVDALAAAMARLIDDTELCADLGRGARRRFLQYFELSDAVGRQADWLEDLL